MRNDDDKTISLDPPTDGTAASSVDATQRMEGIPTDLHLGARLADRYTLLQLLGFGGMGVVYRARDEVLGIEVALKVLRKEVADDPGFLVRFHQELLLARQVTHRHVVRIHDIDEHDGLHFMTMDLVAGRSLLTQLSEEGRLSVQRATAVVEQIAGALGEAHRKGVVHRDLKPANILMDENGDAFVTDFGVARSIHAHRLTSTGEIVGTPAYLSPEQARGEAVDGRSDLYALGIMFFEMLSGELPFRSGTPVEMLAARMSGVTRSFEEVGVEVPRPLARFIRRCLARDPKQRFQNADELLEGLAHPQRARRRLRTRRAAAGLAAAVLTVALLAGAVVVWRTQTQSGEPTETPRQAPVSPPVHSLAVLPFPETTGRVDLAWTSTGIAEMLTTGLAEVERLRVVESLRVFQYLEDLGFDTARLRSNEYEQLARAFGVDRLVIGRLRAIDDQIRLESSLVRTDTLTSEVQPIYSASGDSDRLFEMVEALIASLRTELAGGAGPELVENMTGSPEALRFYAEGVEALSVGETVKATPALERAVAADPAFAQAWVRLARSYASLRRRDEALAATEQAVAVAGGERSRVAFEARAQRALLAGEPAEARQILQELVGRYPHDTDAQVALADAFGREGRFREAISQLQSTVQLDASHPRIWYLLGRYSIQAGEAQRAIEHYLPMALSHQKELGNQQGQAEVHNALGVGLNRLGRYDEAAENYRSAAAIQRRVGDEGGLAQTLQNLGLVELTRGDYDAAEERFATALAIHETLENQEGMAAAYNARGVLEEERGRYVASLEAYRRALNLRHPLGDQRAIAESTGNVGYAYYLLGEYDNALVYLENALELSRSIDDVYGVIVALQGIGSCRLDQGRWADAQRAFLDALEHSRDVQLASAEAVSLGQLGRVAQYQGRYGPALSSYGRALEILEVLEDRRGLVEYELRSAEALLEIGDVANADALLDRVAGGQEEGLSRGHRAQLQRLRGLSSLRRGDRSEADRRFAEAEEAAAAAGRSPALVQAQLGRGLAALAGGDPDRALATFVAAEQEATRLGHAVLELQVRESLSRAYLDRGDLEQATEEAQRALRRIDEGSYGGAFRLHRLLAAARRAAGDEAGATRELAAAAQELTRLRENLDDSQRATFEGLPEVTDLLQARR